LENKIDEINESKPIKSIDTNIVRTKLREVSSGTIKEYIQYLNPLIDEVMSEFSTFQRYENNSNEVTDTTYMNFTAYRYTHRLGYTMTFYIKRNYIPMYEDDTLTDIIDNLNANAFCFDIQITNKNYSNITERNFNGTKEFGAIQIGNTTKDEGSIEDMIKRKIRAYASHFEKRKN